MSHSLLQEQLSSLVLDSTNKALLFNKFLNYLGSIYSALQLDFDDTKAKFA